MHSLSQQRTGAATRELERHTGTGGNQGQPSVAQVNRWQLMKGAGRVWEGSVSHYLKKHVLFQSTEMYPTWKASLKNKE